MGGTRCEFASVDGPFCGRCTARRCMCPCRGCEPDDIENPDVDDYDIENPEVEDTVNLISLSWFFLLLTRTLGGLFRVRGAHWSS